MSDSLVATEYFGSGRTIRTYHRGVNDNLIPTESENSKYRSIKQVFRSVFLPQGYPESVSSDYLRYQIWDTIQAFASSITGTLAAQAVFTGYGVGDEKATVAAATVTWLMKDGTGMLGRILFAWYQGTGLDCDAKRWRLFADMLNDLAICMEILAPLFSYYFTAIVCVAGLCKSIVGVAGGATRAALTQHQARRNNMADVSAKDGSQETMVNLAALICSLTLVPTITGSQTLIWILFIAFTALHLFANYSAVTSVVMETLNQARLHIIVQYHLRHNLVQSPAFVNKREPVLWETRRQLPIKLGARLQQVAKSASDFTKLRNLFEKSRYLLNVDLEQKIIHIALQRDARPSDQLRACYHAEVINYAYIHPHQFRPTCTISDNTGIQRFTYSVDSSELILITKSYCETNYSGFLSHLERNGWLLEPLLLGADDWRFSPALCDSKQV